MHKTQRIFAVAIRGKRIVIPANLTSSPPSGSRSDGTYDNLINKPSQRIGEFLGEGSAEELRSRIQLDAFANSLESRNEGIWRDSRSHLRKQQKLVDEVGVDGAVHETLTPSRISFTKQLMQRPLDKKILEEIYRGLHGRRVERKLKRGVSWEHWAAKGEGTAPVFNTSEKAQQTFGFGGKLQIAGRVRHESQFPTLKKMTRGENLKVSSGVPEVAFIGRTNSGKSSLVNALVNSCVCSYGYLQGTTTRCEFLDVAGKVMLVDMPGYGYYSPLQTPQMDAENAIRIMKAYLDRCDATHPEHRAIKRVYLCASSRGLQKMDLQYLDLLESKRVPFGVILTKTDQAPIRYLARVADYTRSQLVAYKHCQEMFLASSLRLAGIDKIQEMIGTLANPHGVDEAPIDMNFDRIV